MRAPSIREPRRAGTRAALAAVLAVAAACAPRPLLERAIRARGGPVSSLVRQVETRLYTGFPGTWRWRSVLLLPDRYALTIYTRGEANHYVFDGTATRAFVGEQKVATDFDLRAPLRTLARFIAVTNLDALRLPGVRVAEAGPPGAEDRLLVVFADDGSRYELAFGADTRLVAAAGPVTLDPLGAGTLAVAFDDFRPTGGRLLPWSAEFTLGGERFATERTLAACPNVPGLEAAAFATPAALPECLPAAAP